MNTGETIINYIREQLAPNSGAIDLDSNLYNDGHLDSTAMLELILWLGDTFNLTIENEDLTPENFATPRQIVDFIERKTTAMVSAGPLGATTDGGAT